ncbi:MAG: hypothetical protein JWP34_2571 [Massilia sp.]|nr:hypothetical protein [Massilia sp.]
MRSADKIEAQAADWIARRDGDGWTQEQQAALDAWLHEDVAHRVGYLRLDSSWRRADRLGSLRVPGRRSVAERTGWRLAPWRMAAGFLLVVCAGWYVSNEVHNLPTSYATTVGESRPVAMADGSRVLLNTDTHLRTRLAKDCRMVWLDSGEAYFEVAHDASRPFVVEAGDSRITVLGTKFSVRRDGGRVQVVVVEGRVQVGPTAAGAVPAVVSRNDVVLAERGHVDVTRETDAGVDGQLGWRQGKLIFDQMTLAQAAQEFNRYNNRKLVVDADAAGLRIGGAFKVDNVDGFARLLNQGFGLKVATVKDQAGKDEIRISR